MPSRPNSVIWMDDETHNQTNNNNTNQDNHDINPNPISTFKSMLQIEQDNNNNNNNWFFQSHNDSPNSSFQNIDPTHVHFFLPPISSINETFDLGYGVLPGVCDFGSQSQIGGSDLSSDPQFQTNHLLQLAGNGFGSTGYPFSETGSPGNSFILNRQKLIKPLDNINSTGAPPTLFQKRAARNLNDGGGGSGGGGLNENKRKSSGGSWDDVDDLSFDGSSLHYDSDDFTVNAADFDENGVKIGGGDSSMANSTVSAAAGGGGGGGGNNKGKKKGPPAKNLMAERRRRKKLNDRLYMLRSVVPKISKMDRASILGDAIEYLKELLQKINDLNLELEATPPSSSLTPTAGGAGFYPLTPTPSRIKEELCPTAIPSPTGQPARVEVRQREGRAVNIHMFCSRRPGFLLSTIKALDDLGLDIQQAVISCFNGFALDVFRAEQCKEGQDVHPDEVRAVLLECAGYHGVA